MTGPRKSFILEAPDDDVGLLSFVPKVAKRIMVIGDLHTPYMHPRAIQFLRKLRDDYNPDLVVQIGDETDGHAISFHDSDPDLPSAGQELQMARAQLDQLYKLFPNMLLCSSNHGSLVYRRAKAHGLPVEMIRKYRDILFPKHGAPGWSWAYGWSVLTPGGTVVFRHQASGNGLNDAAHSGSSLVIGHEHGKQWIQYAASDARRFFVCYTGCMIDTRSMAFAYGRMFRAKPLLGAVTITNGVPAIHPMEA